MTEEKYQKLYNKLLQRLDGIEKILQETKYNNVYSKWVKESEAIALTGLSTRSLRAKRAAGIFSWSSATGRKIKYLRKDLESYLELKN